MTSRSAPTSSRTSPSSSTAPTPGPHGAATSWSVRLRAKPGLRRYLRRTKAGLLRIDQAAIKREQHLHGKLLLRTSDLTLTADDLAAAYKQLLHVERGWRDFEGALGLRPVFHHREDRIRAHIQLCWLALLLLRVIENATGYTCATPASNSTGCTWSPWPPAPAGSPNAPQPPPANRPCSAPSTCPNRPGSSTSPSPRAAEPPNDTPARVEHDPNRDARRLRRSTTRFKCSCAHDLRQFGLTPNPRMKRPSVASAISSAPLAQV